MSFQRFYEFLYGLSFLVVGNLGNAFLIKWGESPVKKPRKSRPKSKLQFEDLHPEE